MPPAFARDFQVSDPRIKRPGVIRCRIASCLCNSVLRCVRMWAISVVIIFFLAVVAATFRGKLYAFFESQPRQPTLRPAISPSFHLNRGRARARARPALPYLPFYFHYSGTRLPLSAAFSFLLRTTDRVMTFIRFRDIESPARASQTHPSLIRLFDISPIRGKKGEEEATSPIPTQSSRSPFSHRFTTEESNCFHRRVRVANYYNLFI